MKYQLIVASDSLAEIESAAKLLQGTATPNQAIVASDEPLTGVQTPAPNVPAATPPSVATAPASPTLAPAPSVASATPGGAVDLDPRGYYWDARIHSSSKERIVKGNLWKYKRNTPEALIAQVEAEQRAQGFGAGAAKDPDIITPVATSPAPLAAPITPAPVGLPPASIALPSAPAATVHRGVLTGERFTKYIADPTKPDSPEQTKAQWARAVLEHFGVENLPALVDTTDEVLDSIDAYLSSNGL